MSKNVLTAAIAKEFLTGNISDLTAFTAIEDAAAELLAGHKGRLYLTGLTSLSDAAAEALAKHKGELGLGSLTSLSDSPGHLALAVRLTTTTNTRLVLNGLTSLSDAAAEALAKHKGELHLNGVAKAAVTRARKKLKQGK